MAGVHRWGFLLAFIFAISSIGYALADAGVDEQNAGFEWSQDDSAGKMTLLKEITELKARLSILDSSLKDAKRESIEKSKKILFLENELENHQNQQAGRDLESELQDSEAKAADSAKQAKHLEESVLKLEKALRSSEQRLDHAQAKNSELSEEVDQLQKTVNDLQKKLRSSQDALRIAEAAMLQAQTEAANKARELYKAYEAWLPPWAASRLARAQSASASYWATHGKPFVAKTTKQVSKKAATAKKWAEPHVNNIKKRTAPAVQKYWKHVLTTATKRSKFASSKLREAYESAWRKSYPYVARAKQYVEPYVEVVQDRAGPYVDQAADCIRPAFEATGPYLEKAWLGYEQVVSAAVGSHQEVQKVVRGMLLEHNATVAWAASREVVWFLALAVIVLPCIMLILVITSLFGTKKSKSPSRPRKHRRNNKTTTSPSSSAAA